MAFDVNRFSTTPSASRAVHRGNMGALARLSFFGVADQLRLPGIAQGFYTATRATYREDIHLWKRLGLVKAPIVFADGEIGSGKTSKAIVSALDASKLAVDEGREFKIMYEISRRNVGVAELSSLTRALNADVIDMSTYGINIFDMQFGLTKGELLDVVLECFNYVERRDANTFEVTVIMAALRKFLVRYEIGDFGENPSNPHFEKCLATLTIEDFQAAVAEQDDWSPDGDAESDQEQVDVDYHVGMLMPKDVDVDERRFHEVRNACLLSVNRLRKGEFGQVFSGKHSFVELFDRSALGIDLTSLNEATIGLVQTLLWKFKRSAANSADAERRSRFVFDWEIHDENREMWLQGPYRREVPRYLKRIRAVNCVMWFNVHRIPGDYSTLPEPARSAALNALQEGTIFFHGRHEQTPARQTCEHFGYSDKVLMEMQRLGLGEFIFRAGMLPPQRITITLSQSQLESTFSEEASAGKTKISERLAALIT